MLHRLINRNFTAFFVAALAVFLGLSAHSSYADDVSLSEVPQAVRTLIERETKGFEIDDIERDKDDGKIVYEVDAENDSGEMKLKIAKDGTLLELEQEMNPENLPEAIRNAVKKSFGEVFFDDIEKRYRKGSVTVYRIEAETDELKIDLKIAEDGKIIDKEVDRRDDDDDDDDDLPRDFDDIRKMFILLRGQLKVVSIGDSRVELGINPELMLDEQNRKYPTALNLSADYSHGSGVPLLKLMAQDYLVHAPKLEWVIFGASSRMFSRYFRPDIARDISKTRIYRKDKKAIGWREVKTDLVPASAVDGDDLSPWGFDGDDGTDDDLDDDDDREDKIDDLQKGRYKLVPGRFDVLESAINILAEQNVKLLAFTPPIHPITAGQPCTDDDGTPREAFEEIVSRMTALDKKYPNFYFLNIHNKGEHDFKHREFKDMDHLNRKGAKKLTLMLDEFIKKNNAEQQQKTGNIIPQ
ncbi:MAG: PepSY domain-containing protein [Planctomycetota bacterium]|jgi:uncharacterized membrane protein YkoI